MSDKSNFRSSNTIIKDYTFLATQLISITIVIFIGKIYEIKLIGYKKGLHISLNYCNNIYLYFVNLLSLGVSGLEL